MKPSKTRRYPGPKVWSVAYPPPSTNKAVLALRALPIGKTPTERLRGLESVLDAGGLPRTRLTAHNWWFGGNLPEAKVRLFLQEVLGIPALDWHSDVSLDGAAIEAAKAKVAELQALAQTV